MKSFVSAFVCSVLIVAILCASGTIPGAISLAPTLTGLSMFDNSGTAVTTVVSVKASAAGFYGYYIGNPNSTTCYLQIFNVGSGSVMLGSTVPNLTLPIPPQNVSNGNGGANLSFSIPIAFSTALSVASTTTPNGGITTGCGMIVNLWFQ
jgi:hypothetical protein